MARRLVVDKRALFRHLGYEPHAGQIEVHRSKAPRRVLACGVRWGKSRCAAMEAIAAAMEPRERSVGWVVGPTYDLADKVFREILYIAAGHLRHRVVTMRESERKLVLRNLGGGFSEIRGKSADNPVSLLGEGLDYVIVDEASRMKSSIWEGHLSQRLIDRKGWALLISTPRGKGWFHDLYRRGQRADEHCQSWAHPSWMNPYLDRALIEAERARLPDRVFRQEYGGEFLEGSGSVFRNVREVATNDWKRAHPQLSYFAGLDLAKVADWTVLVVMNERREVVFVDRFHKLDWSMQVSRIRAAAARFNEARVLVDSTGVGEPIYESLRAADCIVDPYVLTARSKNDLINNLALLLEEKRIKLPKPELCPEMIDELEAFEYSVTDNGNVRTGAPSGYHDDCVIALALAAWCVERHPRIGVYMIPW